MADVYGVVPGDISAVMKNLFPNGFGDSTTPTKRVVADYITAADLHAQMAVRGVASGTPSSTDAAADMARRYIRDSVRVRVLMDVYEGRDPEGVERAIRVHRENEKAALEALERLGERAIGEVTESPPRRVASHLTAGYVVPRRLLVDDEDLARRERRY